MNFQHLKYYILLASGLIWFSCTKEVPPELQNKQKQQTEQQMPDDSIHKKFMNPHGESTGSESESKSNGKYEADPDEKAVVLTKEADEADSKFKKSKSEADKEECIEKQMLAANYLMFESELPPREKYKPALYRYRRVLEIDPGNKEALANKNQIEEIYKSMGKPIP